MYAYTHINSDKYIIYTCVYNITQWISRHANEFPVTAFPYLPNWDGCASGTSPCLGLRRVLPGLGLRPGRGLTGWVARLVLGCFSIWLLCFPNCKWSPSSYGSFPWNGFAFNLISRQKRVHFEKLAAGQPPWGWLQKAFLGKPPILCHTPEYALGLTRRKTQKVSKNQRQDP